MHGARELCWWVPCGIETTLIACIVTFTSLGPELEIRTSPQISSWGGAQGVRMA